MAGPAPPMGVFMMGKEARGDAGEAAAPFIVIEGIDGAGKTTQLKRLRQWMEARYGGPVHTTGEPTNRPIGRLLKDALQRRVELHGICHALLFAADRIDHVKSEIESHIHRGIPVLCDRYFLSSFAYQWREMPGELDWIESINARAIHPHLTLLIDAPAEVCMDRIRRARPDTELFEDLETLRAIRENYLELARRRSALDHIRIIDGARTPDEVQEEARARVEEVMQPSCSG